MQRASDRTKHKVFTSALRGAEPGEAVEVPKTALRTLPRSYEETLLGTPPSLAVAGSRKQYRGPYGRHAYEKPRSWVVHRDAADPRQDPIEHLVTDAPEWGAGLLAAGIFGISAARSTYERAVRQGADRNTAARNGVIDGLVVGAAAGLVAYGSVRFLKAILREE